MKKRLLFMINDMSVGGAEVGLVDVLNELTEEYDVDLLLLRKKGILIEKLNKKVNVISLCYENSNPFNFILNKIILFMYFSGGFFNKILYKMRLKAVYDAEIAYIEGYPAIFISNSPNKKSIKISSIRVGLLNHKLKAYKIPWGKHLLIKAYKKMDYIHCVSSATANEFTSVFPGNEEKVRVLYTYFNSSEIIRRSKEQYSDIFRDKKINLLAVGRFNQQKGYERLIDAMNIISKKYNNVELHFIGRDNNEYGSSIKMMTSKYQLDDIIHFHGEKENPYPYIKNCDLLVSSSYYEGYPRVINEALCLNKICVGTNVTGTQEALADNKGILVNNSVDGIVEGITKFLEKDDLIELVSQQIRNFDGNKSSFFTGLKKMINNAYNTNCLLVTDIYPHNGEAFVHNEILYMSKIFNKIDIICTNPNSSEFSFITPDNVRIHYLKKWDLRYITSNFDYQIIAMKELLKSLFNRRRLIIWGKNYYYSAVIKAKINKLTKQTRYKVMFSYWFHWSSLAIARTKYNSLKIARAHGYDLYSNINPQLYKKYILSKLDFVYPVSKRGMDEIKKQTNMNNVKSYFLGTYNSTKIDFSKFNNSDIIKIVSCSRVVEVKRIDLIIRILQEIDPDIRIKWVHFGDGELLTKLKKQAHRSLSNKKNISYEFMGFKSNGEILKYYENNYNTIDFFVNTSVSEGIPVSIMEASSYGIIPIATNVGGTSELVDKNLIDFKNDDYVVKECIEIIKKYKELTTDKKRKQRQEVYKNWDLNFNAEKNYQKFYDNEVLEKIDYDDRM